MIEKESLVKESSARESSAKESSVAKEAIVQEKLGAVLYDLAELELDALDFSDTFKELGIDSYTTLRLSRALELAFQVKVSYKHLISEIINLEGLLDFIVARAPEHLITN